MKLIENIILVILLIILGVAVFFLWTMWPKGEIIEYQPYVYNSSQFNIGETIQFYDNMRYPSNRISYFIKEGCDSKKNEQIIEAFSMISKKTYLQFYPDNIQPEIIILCTETDKEAFNSEHYIAGEGGPSKIVNTTNFYIIKEGRVSLFRSERCDRPIIATHEILHALGFDHNDNPDSLMYPIANCNQQIDDLIIDELNRLYSIGSFPDLSIEEVDLSKSGIYISFKIEISNLGITDAPESVLKIFADNQLIKEFDLDKIAIGVKKELNVQNLKTPIGADKFSFAIVSKIETNDLNPENNKVTISQ